MKKIYLIALLLSSFAGYSQLQLPYSVKLVNPAPVDFYYGPWATVAAAKAGVPLAIRYDGQTVKITGLGEYHWLAADLTDTGLIAKSGGATPTLQSVLTSGSVLTTATSIDGTGANPDFEIKAMGEVSINGYGDFLISSISSDVIVQGGNNTRFGSTSGGYFNPRSNGGSIIHGDRIVDVGADISLTKGSGQIKFPGTLPQLDTAAYVLGIKNSDKSIVRIAKSSISGGGGGTPGGSSGQIQYNNAGSFGGLTQLPNTNMPHIGRTVTAATTITQTDDYGTVYVNSATNINITVDPLTINSRVELINQGAGDVTFVNGSGGLVIDGSGSSAMLAGETAVILYKAALAPLITSGAGAGGGTGTIAGSIAADQVALGLSANTIYGASALTYASNKLSIKGTASSSTLAPALNIGYAGDNDPAISFTAYAHANVGLGFDAWYNGTDWISSQANSNFAILKTTNSLAFGYRSGITKGTALPFPGFYTTGLNVWDNGTATVGMSSAPTLSKLQVVSGTSFPSIKAGTFNIQATGTNNSFITDGLYYDGTNFRYSDTGYGAMIQFYNGEMYFNTAPTLPAGSIATGLANAFKVTNAGLFSITTLDTDLTPPTTTGTTRTVVADASGLLSTIVTPGGGGGDMVLASTQTNTGAKTFNNATLLHRNVANTFSGQFTNTITAARTWTLPDEAGTVLLGTGAINQIGYFTSANSQASEAGFEYNSSTNTFSTPILGTTSGNLTLAPFGSYTVTSKPFWTDDVIFVTGGTAGSSTGSTGTTIQPGQISFSRYTGSATTSAIVASTGIAGNPAGDGLNLVGGEAYTGSGSTGGNVTLYPGSGDGSGAKGRAEVAYSGTGRFKIDGLVESVLLSATTLTLSDDLHRGKVIYCTSGSTITITVPSGLPLGFNCVIFQDGAGTVNISASGTTLHGKVATTAQYDGVSLAHYKSSETYLGL